MAGNGEGIGDAADRLGARFVKPWAASTIASGFGLTAPYWIGFAVAVIVSAAT